MVKDCDPSTGEPDEEGYEDEYVVCVGLKFFPFFTLFFFWCMKVFLVRNRGTSSAAKIATLVRQWHRLQALFSHPQSVFSSLFAQFWFTCHTGVKCSCWLPSSNTATVKSICFQIALFFLYILYITEKTLAEITFLFPGKIYAFGEIVSFFPFRYYNHSSVLNDTGPLST